MHRTDGAGNVAGMYVAEDAATNRPPTEVTPEHLNALQEELAGLVEWAGLILSKADNTQVRQALLAKFAGLDSAATKAGVQAQAYTAYTTAGASGAFTLTPAPAITAYAAGQRFRVKFHAAGSGADTVAVSGLAAKAIKQYDATGAKVAAVIAAGQLVDVEYDGVDMVLLDPLPPVSGYNGFRASRTISAATALLAADAGEIINFSGAGSYTVTLPALAAVPDGAVFGFFRTNSSAVTIACNGGEVLWPNGGSVSTMSLANGDTLTVAKVNASWYVVGGSAQLGSAQGVFGASLGANGYQKLPGGLILQWGTSGSIANGGSAAQTFPIAFPTACRSVVISPVYAGSTAQCYGSPYAITNTGFSINNHSQVSSVFDWIAIGC